MQWNKTTRLVKPQELNHHGTLFAGRMSEWFVENCFICGALTTEKPNNIVCVNIHGLNFNTPSYNGDIININSTIVKVGRTSFTVYGAITKNNEENVICQGFITFAFVDENNKSIPHNIILDHTEDEKELELREMALKL